MMLLKFRSGTISDTIDTSNGARGDKNTTKILD